MDHLNTLTLFLTADLVDAENSVTKRKLIEVIDFLKARIS